jgi:hypothetical protein
MEKAKFNSGWACISHCTKVLFPLPEGAEKMSKRPFCFPFS